METTCSHAPLSVLPSVPQQLMQLCSQEPIAPKWFRLLLDFEVVLCLQVRTGWFMMSAPTRILVNFASNFSVWKPAEAAFLFCFVFLPVMVDSIIEHLHNVVLKLLIVKRLVFPGQPVSPGFKLSACLICAAVGVHLEQRWLPMSNVTALICFQCRPGVTAAHLTNRWGF